jgi:hypothetical protein
LASLKEHSGRSTKTRKWFIHHFRRIKYVSNPHDHFIYDQLNIIWEWWCIKGKPYLPNGFYRYCPSG